MPQVAPLTTSPTSPLVNQAGIGKLAGAQMHFPTRAAFDAAIAAAGTVALWAAGQRMTISGEPSVGYRVWNSTHARTFVLPDGTSVVLAADTSTVLSTTGTPAAGTGANGDFAIDQAAKTYYGPKASGQWPAGVSYGGGALTVAQQSVAALTLPLSRRIDESVAVVIGDSVTANGLANGPAGDNGRSYSLSRSIVRHANRMLGAPWRIVNEVGFPGESTTALFARWDVQVAAYNPGTVFWESGINNAGGAATDSFAAIKAVHLRAVAEGRRFVYFVTGFAVANEQWARYLAMCRQYARQDRSFEFVDAATVGLDYNQNSANLSAGAPKSNYIAADGTNVHPTARYAVEIGRAMVQHFQDRGYPRNPLASPYNSNTTAGDYLSNVVRNGLVGAAGDWWFNYVNPGSTRIVTASQVDMGTTGLQARLPGRLYQAVWAPGTGAADDNYMTQGVGWDPGGGFEAYAGKTYSLRGYIKATATGGDIHEVSLAGEILKYDYSSRWAYGIDNFAFDLTGASVLVHSMATTGYEGIFETQLVIPSGVTQCHMTTTAVVRAAPGATVTVQAGAFEMRELFAL